MRKLSIKATGDPIGMAVLSINIEMTPDELRQHIKDCQDVYAALTGQETGPGRALWMAVERKRLKDGSSKEEITQQMGISRVTFDRLLTQENPPIGRTVRKIADYLGLDFDEVTRMYDL